MYIIFIDIQNGSSLIFRNSHFKNCYYSSVEWSCIWHEWISVTSDHCILATFNITHTHLIQSFLAIFFTYIWPSTHIFSHPSGFLLYPWLQSSNSQGFVHCNLDPQKYIKRFIYIYKPLSDRPYGLVDKSLGPRTHNPCCSGGRRFPAATL